MPITHMMKDKTLHHLQFFAVSVIAMGLLLTTTNLQAGNSGLLEKYEQIKDDLEQNIYGIPIYIKSTDAENTTQGRVYGIIYHPFQKVRQALTTPDNWCEIAPQHLNIKACTYQPKNDHCELTFYSGRKFYEKADDVYQLPYRFYLANSQDTYFQIDLSSDKGPMGTRDYSIQVEAMPLDDSTTFIHFSYSYHYNFFTRLGMQVYLSTFGRNKVGFSVEGTSTQDAPEYIHGIHGIIERNAVRYYLAIQSYLDTEHIQDSERFSARITRWFDLTEKHSQQLYELEKEDYLAYKQLERQDQLRLQRQLVNTTNNKKKCTIE